MLERYQSSSAQFFKHRVLTRAGSFGVSGLARIVSGASYCEHDACPRGRRVRNRRAWATASAGWPGCSRIGSHLTCVGMRGIPPLPFQEYRDSDGRGEAMALTTHGQFVGIAALSRRLLSRLPESAQRASIHPSNCMLGSNLHILSSSRRLKPSCGRPSALHETG